MSYQILNMTDTGAKFEDFAVLVRSSYLTRAIEQSFMRNKISYVIWAAYASSRGRRSRML
jgi:superfamily I DNA/RNA helicase